MAVRLEQTAAPKKTTRVVVLVMIVGFLLQGGIIVSSPDVFFSANLLSIVQETTDQPRSQQQQQQPISSTNNISLQDLVSSSSSPPDCGPDLVLFRPVFLPEAVTHPPNRQIPKLVHFTSKQQCLTSKFEKNLDLWKFENYTVILHDDAAVEELLYKRHWEQFPHMRLLRSCMVSGAALADVWRMLVLWEYGGIYSDIDNAPGELFQNAQTISDDDQAYFVIDMQTSTLSQYFLAAKPRHPILYLTIHHLLYRLLGVDSVANQYVPYVTGPGALNSGSIEYLKPTKESDGYFRAGVYTGVGNTTIKVQGGRKTDLPSNKFVQRGSVGGGTKKNGYATMGMVHFGASKSSIRDSCLLHLAKTDFAEAS